MMGYLKHPQSDLENDAWGHSINMYAKWARLAVTSEAARRMMKFHRGRFPAQTRVFDEIDREIAATNRRNKK